MALHAFVIVTLEATGVWHSAVAAGAGEVMTTPPAVVPCAVAVLVASSGLTEMTCELTTIADPAMRMYASPQAFNPVPGSTPHVG